MHKQNIEILQCGFAWLNNKNNINYSYSPFHASDIKTHYNILILYRMILLVLVTLLSHEIIAQGGIFDARAGIFDLIKFPVSLHKILEFRR